MDSILDFLASTSVTGMTEVMARKGQVQSLDIKALIKDTSIFDNMSITMICNSEL